jgi:hypothetical protein
MDTNVAVVANGGHDKAGPNCIRACIDMLRQIRDEQRILLDDKQLILTEYRKNLSPSGQPGPGDAFFKLLHENQSNPSYCRIVAVNFHPERELKEFPADPELDSFDRKDRKFVAVALASGTQPHILNASDTDWWQHRQELLRHGVEVVFLCPELMHT